MSRVRLREALDARVAGEPAIVPLVEAHAARLEQLADASWTGDPEAQARMLRAVQGLYGLDAVTIGGGGLLVASACWSARSPSLAPADALAAARDGRALGSLPSPQAVAEARPVATARQVLARLRPVLGERAGIMVVLPDASRLAAELGVPDERDFAAEALAEVVRTIGADEPDGFLVVGDDDAPDAVIEGLAEFFGVPVVACGAARPPGVVLLDAESLTPLGEADGWLYTTAAEVPAGADPQALRDKIAALRAR